MGDGLILVMQEGVSFGIGGAFRTFVDRPRPLDYKEPESAAKGRL